MALINPCEEEEVTVEVRDTSQSQYLLKLESFSKLSENGIDIYESKEFEACNCKWRMIIYPNGDDGIEGKDYISVCLAIADTSSLPVVWEVNVVFSFFLFNRLFGNYLVIRGQSRRFRLKSIWGFPKCISHKSLKEPTNGYLDDDTCILGAEVFVIKNQAVGECLSLSKGISSNKHEWKIFEFSKLSEACRSKEFTAGNHKWKLLLYPAACSGQNGMCISIYLVLIGSKEFGQGKKVKVKYNISVKDQFNGAHHELGDSAWFSASGKGWSWKSFMPLHKLKDPKKGFLVNDFCIVDAHVSVICIINEI